MGELKCLPNVIQPGQWQSQQENTALLGASTVFYYSHASPLRGHVLALLGTLVSKHWHVVICRWLSICCN